MDTISDGVSNLSSKVTGLSPSSFFPWLRLVLPKSSSHHGQLSVSSTADFIPVIYSSSFCSSRCRAICRLQAVPCRQPQAPPIIHFSASLSPLTIPSPLVRPRMPIMDPSQRKLSFPSSSPVKSGEPRDFWVSIGPWSDSSKEGKLHSLFHILSLFGCIHISAFNWYLESFWRDYLSRYLNYHLLCHQCGKLPQCSVDFWRYE